MGIFIGVLLVVGAPFVLWNGENQHRADDFTSAQQVEAVSEVEGYITFQGEPVVENPLSCIDEEQSCLYYNKKEQELKLVTEEQCGTVSEDATILYETVLECDEGNINCEQCYMVEKEVWETLVEDTQYGEATVGSYTVKFNEGAAMQGVQETTISHSYYERDVWRTFLIPQELRVAGDAYSNIINGAQKLYVLSPYSYEGTLAELTSQDEGAMWMIRIITFLMLFFGFSSILGPLSYVGFIMKRIPLIGPMINEVSGAIVGIVSFILAVISFIVFWILVTVIKNIFIVIAVLILIAVGFFLMARGNEAPKAAKEKK